MGKIMKKIRRLLSVFIIIVMGAGIFAGCGKSEAVALDEITV
jgi:hypothetical protein